MCMRVCFPRLGKCDMLDAHMLHFLNILNAVNTEVRRKVVCRHSLSFEDDANDWSNLRESCSDC